jgi:hypothetical protein
VSGTGSIKLWVVLGYGIKVSEWGKIVSKGVASGIVAVSTGQGSSVLFRWLLSIVSKVVGTHVCPNCCKEVTAMSL